MADLYFSDILVQPKRVEYSESAWLVVLRRSGITDVRVSTISVRTDNGTITLARSRL